MLLLWVALALVFLWIFFPMGPKARFKKYENMVHPYSGLDPESWKRFLVNLRQFEDQADKDIDVASNSLYGAIENIRDLALGLRRADDGEIQSQLQYIGNKLGYEGEFIINQKALARGLQFFPKYLNETLDDYPEDVTNNWIRTARAKC